jgi:hypothetical protein
MRLPTLLVANALLTGFSFSQVSICTQQGYALRVTLVPRMCAAGVGVVTDVVRRYMFLRQQHVE